MRTSIADDAGARPKRYNPGVDKKRRSCSLRIAAILLACVPGVRASSIDCSSSYEDRFADWTITRAQWDADCAVGRKPEEILRQRQRLFMEDCAAYYRPYLAKAKVEDWNLGVYCAEGAAGERKLSTMSGAPPRLAPPAPPESPAATANKPGASFANPAVHFYNLIDTTGSVLPITLAETLPPGLEMSPQLRYYGTIEYRIYVSQTRRPPLCVLMIDSIEYSTPRCYVRSAYDEGCTGRLSTMRLTTDSSAPECGQKQIDKLYSRLEATYLKTHPALPR